MIFFDDPKSKNARIWSNSELKKFCKIFKGDVCNVSAWNDIDKEGSTYKEYFSNAKSYSITNYGKESARGTARENFYENEIILDLTDEIRNDLIEKFDLVFNHTTLEHIFECQIAFSNLCKLTKDIVIVVVPFLQETHGDYGDFWRFTPQCLDKMFRKNGMETIYINSNDQGRDSIYVFAIGSKKPSDWNSIIEHGDNRVDNIYTEQIGTKIIQDAIGMKLRKIVSKFRKKIF
jgi:hypothetical protein